MSKIAFLGLGAMGARMAMRLVKAGHEASVWNRTAVLADPLAAEGAVVALTPAEAAKGADFVISMVRDDDASRTVWTDEGTGALSTLGSNAVAIEMSTLTPGWTKELAGQVSANGASFLEAPVAGSRPQAEAGQLIILAGGEVEVLEQARPVLSELGGAIHHAGPVGSGAVMKLVVNSLFGVQVATMAELMVYMEKQGMALDNALEILSAMPVTSAAASGAAGMMAAGKFAPMFPIELVEKDFGYAVSTGENAGAKMSVAAAVRDVFANAIKQGFGGDNISGVIQLYKGAA